MDTAQRTAAALGIDFGTHNTVATVLRADGRRHQLLFEGGPLLPSGIYLDHDASVMVGRDAARAGRRHPDRYERNPKLQIDAPSLLLGDSEIPIRDAVAAVIGRVLRECVQAAGPPRQVTVTVPAGWGPARRHIIEDAAASAGAPAPALLPEPVAAARYFVEILGHELPLGQAAVVFDLGAGTFDASVVARTDTGYEVLAVDGSDRIGGHYLDQALVEYLGGRYAASEDLAERWRALLDPNSDAERRRLRFALYDEIRDAKERLSRTVTTDIVVPGFATEELLTRSELELLARPLLAQAVTVTKAAIREAGRAPGQLAGIFMVGGASRMPLATTMLHHEIGIAPTLIEQPELVVSEGAATAPTPPATPPASPMPPIATPMQATPPAVNPAPAFTPAAFPATPPLQATRPLPLQQAPPPKRRGRALLLGGIALAIAVITAGALLIYAHGGRDPDGTTVSEGAEASSGEPGSTSPSPGASSEEPAEDDIPADWGAVSIIDVRTTATSITVVTDAPEDFEHCSARATGTTMTASWDDRDCGEIVLESLYASDTYTIELYGPDQSAEPITRSVSTDTVYGEVYWDCPQTRTYCREQGGEPGIRSTVDGGGDVAGFAAVGEIFELTCYGSAELITPRGEEVDGPWDYHPGKEASSLMIQIEYGDSHAYIPFVWVIIDAGDLNSTGELPAC